MSQDRPARRVALVGYGLAGAVFHGPLIRATPGLHVRTIVTGDSTRQEAARRAFPDARVEADVGAVWARPGDHDLVVVATPNRSHASLARAAIEAGIDVVVDKPLAPTAGEARALVHLAAEHGRLLTVFHNRRWDGDMLTLRALIDRAELGRVLRFESRFERWRPRPRAGAWRESTPPGEGGGILLDLGSHVVDQALQLFGRPERVYGEVRAARPGASVDDDAFLALVHPGGTISHLWSSAIASAPAARIRVLGEAGGYEKHWLDIQEEALRAGADPAAPGWGVEPQEHWGRLITEVGATPVETSPGAWPRFYTGVVEALEGRAGPPVDPASAVEVLEVIEAARESAGSGSVVRLAPAR